MANEWLFQQMEGQRKTIKLSGPSAPYGRPRQKPVVADGIELREQTVRYPGSNVPTRHLFGVRYEDLELTGRWKDSFLGPNGANKQVQEFQEFIEDQSKVLISWGNIIAYTGFIKSFIPKREAPYEVSWEMKIIVDTPTRNQTPTPPGKAKLKIIDYSTLIANDLLDGETMTRIIARAAPGINPDFLDSLDDLVSNVIGFTGQLNNLANQISSFETALLSDLAKLRAAIGQVKTAFLTLSDTMFSAKDEALFIFRDPDSDITWTSDLASFDSSKTRALALMAEFDRQCEIAERGKLTRSYTAKLGDSWESISTMFFGGPIGAGTIRSANGITNGSPPQPGFTYTIPSQP